jgi:hypothetical protein
MPQPKQPPASQPQSSPESQPPPQQEPQQGSQPEREVASSPEEAESVAEAPGPITPEHESGSWEQTLAEREAKDKAREEASRKSE